MKRFGLFVMICATGALAAPWFMNLAPTTPPTDRRSAGAAVRRTSPEVYVGYGGFVSGTGSVAQLISFRPGTNAWTTAASTTAARERHGFAYDPVHDVFVVAGGVNGATVTDTVFLVNGSSLTQTAPPSPATRPSSRLDSLLQWIPPLQKFLYYGGRTSVFANSHVGDSWTLDVADGGVTWAVLGGSNPPARGASCNGVDPATGKVYMFGGEGSSNLADTWVFSPDAGWSSLTVTGTVPSARAFSACTWDENIHQLVLYGGATNTPVGGLFTFDPATNVWTSFSPTVNPGPLSDTVAAYSPALGGVVFFAGQNAAAAYTHETWLLTWNSPPAVDAGPDFSIGENVTATLLGSASDPDGDMFTVAWTQTLGPAVTLSNTGALQPTFTTPTVFAPTQLRFVLTGTDALGAASDAVTVTILNDVDEAPVADAGPDQTVNGNVLVTLAGSGSDPNLDPITAYSWAQIAGPAVTLSSTSIGNPTFTSPMLAGDTPLTFTLQVTAGGAQSPLDGVVVLVRSSAVDAGSADAGAGDAGTDGGARDAGGTDAGGTDAGAPDAGVADAGTDDAGSADDAGTSGPRVYAVGCGCTEVPTSSAWWLAGVVAFSARRRAR